MKANNRQWIILDRDGTLIKDAGYLSDPAGVQLLPYVAEGLRLLAEAGYRFVVVTNQSGVGRGFFSRDDMDAVNARLAEVLSGEGINIEKFYCCMHTPEEKCSCRKPQVGLVSLAQRELDFTASQIRCVVGDKLCDTELAGNLQVDSVLLRGPETESAARGTFAARNFLEAVEIILAMDRGLKKPGKEIFLRNLDEHTETARKMAALSDAVEKTASLMVAAIEADGRVFFCGNGGSAADAQHLASELSGKYLRERAPIDGVALHCNTSAVTAIANDYGYEEIYARQILAHGRKGDVLVAISTSGNSANINKAAQAARETGIKVIGMTGESGGALKNFADVLISVPSTSTPRIQEMHILIGHVLCEIVEASVRS